MFELSCEPISFLFSFGMNLLNGAQVQTDLLLHKICKTELNYSDSICDNLSELNETSNELNEVQKHANNFLMIINWMSYGLSFFYSLFAGSLADIYGYKPFLLGPLIGMFVSDIIMLLNCIYINEFPIEVFFCEEVWSLFGGQAVFYLGIYG